MRKLTDILLNPAGQLVLMVGAVIIIGVSIAATNVEQGQPNRIRAEAGGMILATSTSAPTATPWPTVTAWLDGQPTAIPTSTPWPVETPTLWIPTSTPWPTDTPTAIPTSTPWPTSSMTPLPTQPWYVGGTLHQATVVEWRGATPQNKLATSAEWVTSGLALSTLGELETYAPALVVCIETALDAYAQAYSAAAPIADLVVMCLTLLKDDMAAAPEVTALPIAAIPKVQAIYTT